MKDGLKHKYNITKADGSPVSGRYFILKLDSKDPWHAVASRRAVITYAHAIEDHIPELALDVLGALMDHGRTGTWDAWDLCVGYIDTPEHDEVGDR